MPKTPGTPASAGLLHLPTSYAAISPTVTFFQINGFGPYNEADAFAASKTAALVGRRRPFKVWVQRPRKDSDMDTVLAAAVGALNESKTRYEKLYKEGESAKAGWGVYRQYDDKVVMQHTSDPNSVVKIGTTNYLFPHFHVEVIDYDSIVRESASISEALDKIQNATITTGRGETFGATRLIRFAQTAPGKDTLVKGTHHIYYLPTGMSLTQLPKPPSGWTEPAGDE